MCHCGVENCDKPCPECLVEPFAPAEYHHLDWCTKGKTVPATREGFTTAMERELDHAYAKHGKRTWSRHEFFGIIKEEFDEMWDEIKKDAPTEELMKEIVQVAAMCLRYAETGDTYRGPHPDIQTR